jgi:enamine deaminase RidA (YjgF/YER057c/UK114 family)
MLKMVQRVGRILALAAPTKLIVLDRIIAALVELGANTEHVIETRVYLADIAARQQVERAHAAVFKNTRASSLTECIECSSGAPTT